MDNHTQGNLEINCVTVDATTTQCTIPSFDGFFLWPMSITFILIIFLFIKIFEFKNPWNTTL